MRISKDRQDARIRVTKIELAILEALPEAQDYTELVMATMNVAQRLQEERFKKEHPLDEDKDDDGRRD